LHKIVSNNQPIKNKTLRKLRRLLHAEADIHSARELAEHLLANFATLEKSHARRAMQDGIAISYARPFGDNKGLGSLPQQFREFDHAKTKAFHERMLSARDLVAAHNNILDRDFLLSPVAIEARPHKITIEVQPDRQTEWEIQIPSLDPSILKEIRDLCFLQERRINAEACEILADLAKGRSYDRGCYVLGETFP
jgi:hypothetical protein